MHYTSGMHKSGQNEGGGKRSDGTTEEDGREGRRKKKKKIRAVTLNPQSDRFSCDFLVFLRY